MAKSTKTVGDLHAGLTRSNPPGDSGMRPGPGRVDDNATRSDVARTPATLGPREA